jgi:uncharacterized membrane protein
MIRSPTTTTMKEWLTFASENAIILLDLLALVVALVGSIEGFVVAVKGMFSPPLGHERREAGLRVGRWLVMGLTFQLAADIIETSITTSWVAVGRIGAVAVIRTFLNYFLERDLADVRARQHEADGVRPADTAPVAAARR